MDPIKQIPPEKRLEYLQQYISHWINHWPRKRQPFDAFIRHRYPYLFPGTVSYARRNATHCYYCNGKFGNFNTRKMLTIDHFYPVSKVETIGPAKQIIVVACRHCNISKGNSHPYEWLRQMYLAQMEGRPFFGFYGHALNNMVQRATNIFNADMAGSRQTVYYIERPLTA